MITRFEVQNYRNIKDAKLDGLKAINVLIGPNNSGKTNLLSAMSLYAHIVSLSQSINIDSALLEAIGHHGGAEILSRSSNERNIRMTWSFEPTTYKRNPYTYFLEISMGKGAKWRDETTIKQEKLEYTKIAEGKAEPFRIFDCNYTGNGNQIFQVYSKQSHQLKPIKLKPKNNKVVLEQIQDLLLQSQEYYEFFKGDSVDYVDYSFMKQDDLKKYFSRFFDYASASFNLEKIRRNRVPAEEKKEVLLKDASNFSGVLFHYLTDNKNPQFREKFEAMLKDIFRKEKNIGIHTEEEGNEIAVKLRIKNELQPLREQSDGTLKAMVLALLLAHSPRGGISVMTIDEPELNLHPAWIHKGTQWLFECSNEKQIFVSTHSPELLDKLTDAYMHDKVGVIVYDDWNNRFWMLPKQMVQKKIDEGWELGDLYRVGDPLIGGWPW